jgi:hypothetical protein
MPAAAGPETACRALGYQLQATPAHNEEPTMTDDSTAAVSAAAAAATAHHETLHALTDLFGMLVPISAIVMGIGLAMLAVWLRYQRQREMYQLYHAERMAAIEKGIDLPPLPPEFFQPAARQAGTGSANLRRGMILLFLGIAVTVALFGTHEKSWWWGLVPTAIGVAYLLVHRLERVGSGDPEHGS